MRRGRVVLAGLTLALAVLLAASRTWLRADLTGLLTGIGDGTVTGTQAAPVVPALALVALAGAAAVTIAGRLGRLLAGAAVLLSGAGIVGAAVHALRRPAAAAADALSEATSGVGIDPAAVAVTAWPSVTAVTGTLLAACGTTVLLLGRSWDAERRFERAVGTDGGGRGPSDWDAISHGADPTARDAGEAQG